MPMYTFSKPYYNTAGVANTLAVEEAYNVYFETMPQGGFAIRRRPGAVLLEGVALIGEAQGLYWSDRNETLYQARNNAVYSKIFAYSPSSLIGSLPSIGYPAVFAEGQKLDLTSLVYIANGNHLIYIDPSTNTLITPSDANTPSSKFIAMMGNRFFATDNNHGQDFLITDVNPGSSLMDVTYWSSAVNPFRAAQKPDYIEGIYTGWNEVYIWGQTACEVWQEDGVTPVSPLVGSLIEAGCSSPYSVVMANNSLIALATVAGKRAVITISRRSPQVISEPIANILQSYSNVSDAVGSLCFVGGLNIYLLTFPTENVTWAYDFKTDTWSRWSQWDSSTATHDAYMGKFGTYAKTWNAHVVMSSDGSLYQLDRGIFTDAGAEIRSSVRTGWVDHGTWERKRCDQLVIKLQGYAPNGAKVLMRTRTDGFPEWSTAVELEIQSGQQNDHFCKLNRMGMYRSRQYEFIMTDAADLALVGLEENLTSGSINARIG